MQPKYCIKMLKNGLLLLSSTQSILKCLEKKKVARVTVVQALKHLVLHSNLNIIQSADRILLWGQIYQTLIFWAYQ